MTEISRGDETGSAMQNVLGIILGGGVGAGLFPLTRHRSIPAVPVAGKYRLIDVPVSNCLNSGITRIYILTQYQSASLHRHIANTYKIDPFHGGFVESLAAQQTNEASDWYRGTADALRHNLRYIEQEDFSELIVLSADQLYRMDFEPLIKCHRAAGAAITLACTPVGGAQAQRMGNVLTEKAILPNSGATIARFAEKPGQGDLANLRCPGLPAESPHLVSMGIYVISRKALFSLLADQPWSVDLVNEILPGVVAAGGANAYRFDGFWDDLGTVASYHSVQISLASSTPPFDFHSPEGVIFTRMRNLPAFRILSCSVSQSLISDGCVVGEGSVLDRTVLGVRSLVGPRTVIRNSVILGANYTESDEERKENLRAGIPTIGIGADCHIENAILDKNCRIPDGTRITNKAGHRTYDGPFYYIRDGLVVIPANGIAPPGTDI